MGHKPGGSKTGHYNCVAMNEDGIVYAMEPATGTIVPRSIKYYAGWGETIIGYYH